MFIIGLLQWWYGAGWRACVARAGERLLATVDFFSIDLLLGSLFSPFRQISAGRVRGSLEVQLRAFFDKLISRLIGAMVRSALIIAGSVVLVVSLALSLIVIIGWLVVPLMPVAGIALSFSGWWLPW